MAPPPQSAVTRSIYLGTFAAIAVVATLSVVIYRSAVDDAVAQHSSQQLAMVRTAAVGVQGEIQAMSARLRQFNSLPSVQNLDVRSSSQRVEAAFGDNANGADQPDRPRRRRRAACIYWTPNGELLAQGRAGISRRRRSGHGRRIAPTRTQVRMMHGWANSVPSRRALVIPVWRTSPSAENPERRTTTSTACSRSSSTSTGSSRSTSARR